MNSQGCKPLENGQVIRKSPGGAIELSPLRGSFLGKCHIPGAYAPGYLLPPLRGFFPPTIVTLTRDSREN